VLTESNQLLDRRLRNVSVKRDAPNRAVWVQLNYPQRPCFSTEVLADIKTAQHAICQAARAEFEQGADDRLLYQILASADARTFSLGGDLTYFVQLIEAGDRDGLRAYGRTCIDIEFASYTHYNIPFTTIALVQGEALGGGFEAALSNNVLIAEESARFGFPEIHFGMFPGMGAVSLLTRKTAPALGRRLIMDRRIHTAEELYGMGIIDVLAPDGEGRAAVIDYMRRHTAIAPGLHGFQAAVDRVMPLSYEELHDIVEHWVDAALQLSEKNRRLMAYFARAQTQRAAETATAFVNDGVPASHWTNKL
jgi:DSF synthase